MNLANKLTVIRIILVPVFVVFISCANIPYGTFIATLIFILASITDKLDGYIARSRNQVTNFGKFMDPLADKLLVVSALILLAQYNLVPAWVVIIITAREFAVSGLRTLAASDGLVLAASWWGKIKTVFQIIAVISLLVKLNISTYAPLKNYVYSNSALNGFFTYGTTILVYAAALATLVSGIDYFVKNKHVINTNE